MQFIFADTETVGFKVPEAPASGVCQAAFVSIDPITFQHLGPINTSLLNPGVPIEASASAIHDILDKDVADAPTLGEFFKPEGPVVLMCHNVSFDKQFLLRHLPNLAGTICTMALSRRLVPDAPNHKLTTMTKHLGLTAGKAHDAGGDVFMGVQLLEHLAKMINKNLHELLSIESTPKMLSIVPFGEHKGKSFVQLPPSYLRWLLSKSDTDKDVRYTAERVLAMKG